MHVHAAIRFDGDRRAGFSRAWRPLVNSYAAADVFRFRLAPSGRVKRFFEGFLDDDALQFLSEGRSFTVVEQVLHSELHRVYAELARDDIDLRFHGECGLRAPRRAGLCARDLIGISAQRFDLNRRNFVVTRHPARSLHGNFRIGFERRIPAAAEHRSRVQGA